jgi:hypothetical protein
MGGYGSGRPSPTGRGKVEDCRRIDVNQLQKLGYLNAGYRGAWGWTSNDANTNWINIEAHEDALKLSYRSRFNGGEWIEIDYRVPIERVPCNLGGSRPYFVCPGVVNGVVCRRRVVKIYARGHYFLCRHCCRLSYQSQSETRLDRLLRKRNKARWKVADNDYDFVVRPKGMWRKTYERLLIDYREAEDAANRCFFFYIQHRYGSLTR